MGRKYTMNILFPDESDISLNLTTFDICGVTVDAVETQYQGYTIETPNGLLDSGTKIYLSSILLIQT